MRLVIATAHRACSLALIEGSEVVAARHELIGRGHAERLVPMIDDLLAGRRPEAILVDVGPGSFTGIRVGIAAARALALAWQVPLFSITSMQLLAARALEEHPAATHVTVALDGGRREVFLQDFLAGKAVGDVVTVSAAKVRIGAEAVIGTGTPLVDIGSGKNLGDLTPDAADARLLPPDAYLAEVRPLYVRAPDAKPAAE